MSFVKYDVNILINIQIVIYNNTKVTSFDRLF